MAKVRRTTQAPRSQEPTPPLRMQFVYGGVAAVVASLAICGFGPSRDESPVRCPAFEDAITTWVRTVEAVDGVVPPEILLGAEGTSPALDAALRERALTRREFRQSARIVLRAVGGLADAAADDAMAASLAEIVLPEGIDIAPRDGGGAVVNASPSLESARHLVQALVARGSPPPSARTEN